MKSTGIVRPIGVLGRIVLPVELRNALDIPIQTPMEFYIDNETIILIKYKRGCVFCDNLKDNIIFKSKMVCRNCINISIER